MEFRVYCTAYPISLSVEYLKVVVKMRAYLALVGLYSGSATSITNFTEMPWYEVVFAVILVVSVFRHNHDYRRAVTLIPLHRSWPPPRTCTAHISTWSSAHSDDGCRKSQALLQQRVGRTALPMHAASPHTLAFRPFPQPQPQYYQARKTPQ